jgi:hypothetical protein
MVARCLPKSSMADYKVLLGVCTILIGLVSYTFYFRDVFKGKTKPDAFSWLIWGILASVMFFAQSAEGGGPGTWATAFTGVVCYVIACVAFVRRSGRLKTIDTISFIGAGLGVGLWYYTHDPLLTVLLLIAIGAMGFVPTFQKAFEKPNEETAITFFLNGCKFALAFLALESFTPVTWLYPVSLTCLNISLAAMIVWKRHIATV